MSSRLQVVRSIEQIGRIAQAWSELSDARGYALSDPAWCAHAARHTHSSSDGLHIACLWRKEQLAAVAPLILVAAGVHRRFEIVGSRLLYEPAEVLARDESAAREIAAHIAGLGVPVLLSRLPSDSTFLRAFEMRARRGGLLLMPGSSGSPYIDCAEGWPAFYDRLPSRIRNIVRRGERALGKLGKLEVQFVRPEPAQTAALLAEALEVELHSWKGRAGSAVLQRVALRDFFLSYGHEASARGELLVALLRFNGSVIAAHVAGVARGTYRQLKIAYDDRHAKYVPGLQLLLHTIRWSFDQGLDAYDFMGSEEPWIRDWTRKVRRHKTMLFYPFSLRGLQAFACDAVERARRRVAAPIGRARGKPE